MKKIKEVIVVEGRDDERAVKKAVQAEIIITHGFGIKKSTFERIKVAQERCGVIVLTDPDHAGEQIRTRINKAVKGCKHAYIPRELATLKDNIGVENASVESILSALGKVHTESEVYVENFTKKDLLKYDLIIAQNASDRRDQLGQILGIGYGNAKTFLRRLNAFSITRDEFEKAVSQIGEINDR